MQAFKLTLECMCSHQMSLGGFQEGFGDGWGGVSGPSGFLQVCLVASPHSRGGSC